MTGSWGELMSDKMNARIRTSFHVGNCPEPGLPENNRTNCVDVPLGDPKFPTLEYEDSSVDQKEVHVEVVLRWELLWWLVVRRQMRGIIQRGL